MVDRAVDAVGYQAVDASGSKEKPNIVLDQLIMVTRPTGGLGIPGLYVPADPGAPDEQSKKGQILISFGKLFEKVRLYSFEIVRSSADIARDCRWAQDSATSRPTTGTCATSSSPARPSPVSSSPTNAASTRYAPSFVPFFSLGESPCMAVVC